MKPHFTWSRGPAWLTLAGLLLAFNGCSFLYNLNTNQCNSTADCHALGKEFADSVCSVAQHVCVANANSSGGSSAGNDNSAGASASGGASPNNGGSGPGGGDVADGGEAGSTACTTNADCIALKLDQPAICQQKSTGNECVLLTSDQCPVLLPTTVAGSSTLELLKTN